MSVLLPIVAGGEGVQPLQVENLHAVGHGGVHGVDRLETVFTVVNFTKCKSCFSGYFSANVGKIS